MGAGDAGGFSKDIADADAGLMCKRSCAGLKEPFQGSGQPHTHTNPLWVLRTPKGNGDQIKLKGTFAGTGLLLQLWQTHLCLLGPSCCCGELHLLPAGSLPVKRKPEPAPGTYKKAQGAQNASGHLRPTGTRSIGL